MRRYIAYFWYVMVHKFWVMVEGRKLGIGWWRLFVHDFTKFYLFTEFIPYARYWFNPDGSPREYDSGQTAKEYMDFQIAWQHHYKHNAHHWDHWTAKNYVTINAQDKPEPDEMPYDDMLEMLADWAAMSRTKGGSAKEFYHNKKHTIELHPKTRKQLEMIL